MAPILTRLVHTDNPFKRKITQNNHYFVSVSFLKNSIKSDKLVVTGKVWKFLKPLSSHKNQYCYLSIAVARSDNLMSGPFLSADVMKTVGSATVPESNCTDSIQHGAFVHWSWQSVFVFLKNNLKNYSKCKQTCNLSIMLNSRSPKLFVHRSLKKNMFIILYECFYHLDKKHDLLTTHT